MNQQLSVVYAHMTKKTTACTLTCSNGFEITGTYCCPATMSDNKEYREQKAYENAMRALERSQEKQKQKRQEVKS